MCKNMNKSKNTNKKNAVFRTKTTNKHIYILFKQMLQITSHRDAEAESFRKEKLLPMPHFNHNTTEVSFTVNQHGHSEGRK